MIYNYMSDRSILITRSSTTSLSDCDGGRASWVDGDSTFQSTTSWLVPLLCKNSLDSGR